MKNENHNNSFALCRMHSNVRAYKPTTTATKGESMKIFLCIMAMILFAIVFVMQAPPGIDDTDQQVITVQDLESYIGVTKLKAINKLTLKDSFDTAAPAIQYLQPSLREKVHNDFVADQPDNENMRIYFSKRPDVSERTGIGLNYSAANNSDWPTIQPCRNDVQADIRYRTGIGVDNGQHSLVLTGQSDTVTSLI